MLQFLLPIQNQPFAFPAAWSSPTSLRYLNMHGLQTRIRSLRDTLNLRQSIISVAILPFLPIVLHPSCLGFLTGKAGTLNP
jgi:hypothetical protein